MTTETDTILSALADLAPLVERERARIDEERELPDSVGHALAEAGFYHIYAPKALGGMELDPVAGFRVIAAVSELDGSVGWNAMISGAYSFLAGRLPDGTAREIYSDRGAAVAGALQPGGGAEIADGGYRVTGRWPFGSGSKHATWFLAQCVVLDDGRPRPGRTGGRGSRPSPISVWSSYRPTGW
jgi:indole-3-acetate monooxygenase